MKKLVLPIALLTMTVIASCKKENTTTSAPVAASKKMTAATPGDGSVTMAGYDGTYKKGSVCKGDPYNCINLPPVVIIARERLQLTIGNAARKGPKAVAELFKSEEMLPVTEYLFPDLKEKLQSGLYGMTLNYDGEDACNYLVGSGTPTQDNFEFVLQFKKQ